MTTDHLTDGALVRRVDGELAADEHESVERHLAGCVPCRRALADIESLSARFSAAVPLADPRANGRHANTRHSGVSPLWRVAAVVAFVAGFALAITPVRAWMAERLGLAPDAATEAPSTVRSPAGAGEIADGVRVAFVPDADRFVVRLSGPQAGGRLSLTAAPGDAAAAEVVGPDAAADLLVLPDGLAIRNRPSATADYRVSVPVGLASVEVRVGDRVAWSGSGRELARAPAVVPLGR